MKTYQRWIIPVVLAVVCTGCTTTGGDQPVTGMENRVPIEDRFFEIDCADVGRYKSVAAGKPFVIEFQNTTERNVQMYWIDPEGNEVVKTSITAGDTWDQLTYIGHPWVARDVTGTCVGAYYSRSDARITIE